MDPHQITTPPNSPASDPELVTLTYGEVAAAVGVSVRTVHRWIKAGKLKRVRESPRVTRKALLEFLGS